MEADAESGIKKERLLNNKIKNQKEAMLMKKNTRKILLIVLIIFGIEILLDGLVSLVYFARTATTTESFFRIIRFIIGFIIMIISSMFIMEE